MQLYAQYAMHTVYPNPQGLLKNTMQTKVPILDKKWEKQMKTSFLAEDFWTNACMTHSSC